MPWLDRLARLRGTPPEKSEPDPKNDEIIQERLEVFAGREDTAPDVEPEGGHPNVPQEQAPHEVATQPPPTTAHFRNFLLSAVAPEAQLADGAITTALVGIDVADGEDPTHVLDLMASLEEMAAVIFRRGDVTFPAGPAEMLLVCPERTPEEGRNALARLQRVSASLGTLRAALFSLDGDPRDSLAELQAALQVCRATGLILVDKTILHG